MTCSVRVLDAVMHHFHGGGTVRADVRAAGHAVVGAAMASNMGPRRSYQTECRRA